MFQSEFTDEMRLEILKKVADGNVSIDDVCDEYDISRSTYFKWRRCFYGGGRKVSCHVYFTELEFGKVKEKAKRSVCRGVSSYVRSAALGKKIESMEKLNMLRELIGETSNITKLGNLLKLNIETFRVAEARFLEYEKGSMAEIDDVVNDNIALQKEVSEGVAELKKLIGRL